MDTVDSLIWLKNEKIFSKCVKYSEQLKVVFSKCLGAINDDILIIGDTGFSGKQIAPLFAGALFLAARRLKINTRLVFQRPRKRGENASDEVISALKRIRPGGAVCLCLSGRLGSIDKQKTFRRYCQERGLRFTSTPSLGSLKTRYWKNLLKAIDVDYDEFHRSHSRVKKMLDFGNVIEIKTKAGTHLKAGIGGCRAVSSDGFYTNRGSGGNLPAGEVFIAPAKKKVEGKVVIDGSSRNRTSTEKIRKNITISIKHGEVADIEGGREARMLRESIEWAEKTASYDWGIKRIGEIGIGLNPNAKIVGSMIIDEKVKGTCHVAIGSNHWFGGTVWAMIHLDQVFKDPKIWIDGRLLRL